MRILWSIYDWMAGHRRIGLGSLIAVTVLLLALVSRVRLREDISDFLPLNSRQQQELKLWQDVSGANRITAIFENLKSQTSNLKPQRFSGTANRSR